MSSNELKYCQRCNTAFQCKVGSIELCQCSKIILNETTQAYLQQNYKDCICITCMKELQEILMSNNWNKIR
ncbi:MAG: cysteine-rich CWC family protein [Chitinophagales bacterium]